LPIRRRQKNKTKQKAKATRIFFYLYSLSFDLARHLPKTNNKMFCWLTWAVYYAGSVFIHKQNPPTTEKSTHLLGHFPDSSFTPRPPEIASSERRVISN